MKYLIRHIRFAIALCWLSAAQQVLADDTPIAISENGDIRSYLLGYEWDVMTFDWQGVDIDQTEVLAKIAANSKELGYVRARAMSALAQMRSETAASALKPLLLNDSEQSLQRRAVDEICAAKSFSEPEMTIMLIELLTRDNAHVRVRAAICLNQLPHNLEAANALASYYVTAAKWELRAVGKQESAR